MVKLFVFICGIDCCDTKVLKYYMEITLAKGISKESCGCFAEGK